MNSVTPIEHIADWEQRLARQDAFWSREILDRPVVQITLPRPNPAFPFPKEKQYASLRDRWLDAQYVAERAVAGVMNTEYLGDALPCAWPNLGPEVFSAFFGQEMEYGPDTSWSIPNLDDWAQADTLLFSEDNFYWRKLIEMTDALLEAGRGKFYTGLTDLHPGADAVAAFRDPQRLNLDLLEYPDDVKRLLDRVEREYFRVFDYFYDKLSGAGQAIATWAGIVSSKKWYVPSNDFSCMVSEAMFEEFFISGIEAEIRHMEASIYHLDGPQALRHLDRLLAIPELNAIQWVYGAGNGRATDWIPIYRRCQNAGKGIQLFGVTQEDLDILMANLRPEGIWMSADGIRDRATAEEFLKRVSRWR
ncbi:MAG: trimethylamine corrinoid protein 2 [Candidatus Hydrogenedentes bacterium]|nr:trimethylamine corrinoid protein 2 [Candidatus Hydrogenedentota bacterium]